MNEIRALADTEVKKHPIRGGLWGILLGLGAALVLIVTKVVAVSLVTTLIVVIVGVLLGVAWGLWAPPKPVRGEPPTQPDLTPTAATQPVEPAPVAAWADDPGDVSTGDPVEWASPDDTP